MDTYEVSYKRDGQINPKILYQECEKDELDLYGRPIMPQNENTILLDALQSWVIYESYIIIMTHHDSE